MDITVDKDYIDVDDALKRIGGNMGLFKKLLGRFVDGNHLEALESAVRGGNTEEIAHLAHTVKGVSSNLSLVKITAASTELEQLVKNGQDPAACIESLKQAFEVTNGIIAEIVSS